MQVYLAAPFFSDEQISRVSILEQALENNPTVDDYYSPRQHQTTDAPQFSAAWAAEVFQRDVTQVRKADVIVTVADYRDNDADSGTAFEQGMAYVLETPIVMFEETDYQTNLMLTESLTTFISDPSELAQLDFHALPNQPFSGKRL
ncbi:nucleoside 2-deoxyribosyltransferase [Weissella viridescens]|uniref:Purine deoxyribosyltransferase n=1 Tax=Weissella viridescens TaxID=1629 RepID=A0A0R2GY61_WEIVI|nr:nucleoside 2-deoxyribosyltransferase [Weissella viridescens]KRN45699.1 purine deoxyribosyltransferase [Weissella viridescens]GEA95494.1 nucleoside 2-deoxyribosyltransferase [Weissella viridescens]